jgi:hypothetical protein
MGSDSRYIIASLKEKEKENNTWNFVKNAGVFG